MGQNHFGPIEGQGITLSLACSLIVFKKKFQPTRLLNLKKKFEPIRLLEACRS